MCIFSTPKMPAVPQAATFQPTQTPKDLTQGKSTKDAIRKRGLWASIYNPGGAMGLATSPSTTGTTGGMMGSTGA